MLKFNILTSMTHREFLGYVMEYQVSQIKAYNYEHARKCLHNSYLKSVIIFRYLLLQKYLYIGFIFSALGTHYT